MLASAGLPASSYVLGLVGALVVVTIVGWGAWRLRGRILPDWSGAPARLAEVILALAALTTAAQFVGALHAFRRGPVFAATVVTGIAMGLVARPRPRTEKNPTRLPSPGLRGEAVAAVLGVAFVATQWTTHVAFAFSHGMTQPDTAIYHGPVMARFLQQGRFDSLDGIAGVGQRYFHYNSELIHALATMPFGRDVASPLLNLGWAALALLAAWCVGRVGGVQHLSLLGAAALLSLPAFAANQPGQASNDIVCAALFLAAVALLLEGELAPMPTTVAGIAAGLALSTKLVIAVPLVVLSVGVAVIAFRRRQLMAAAGWFVALALFGTFWLVRNWALADNPLPFMKIHLGPISMPARVGQTESVAKYITDGTVWREHFLPGLSFAFGAAWPVVVALPLAGAAWIAIRGHRSLARLAGLAAVLGAIGYVVAPYGAGGRGFAFPFTLRYPMPALLIGVTILPFAFARGRDGWRRAFGLTMAGLIVVSATAAHKERVPAWPLPQLLPGLLAGLAVVAAAVWLARSPRRPHLALAGAVLVALGGVGGWVLQGYYLDHRYKNAGMPTAAIDTRFRDVRHASVAVFGTNEMYPLFGLDLSNRVTKQDDERPPRGVDLCRAWRQILSDHHYRYIVLSPAIFGLNFLPPAEWFATDPAVTEVVHDGVNIAFRVDGRLSPDGCPSPTSG